VTTPIEVILGLDVGTTAVKVAAFAVRSPAVGERAPLPTTQREYPLQHPEPGWQVQDPPTVLAAVDEAVTECVDLLAGAKVVAVSIATAMHGLIGLDAGFAPLTPLLTWADSRATDEARQLRRSGQALDLLRVTGTPVHPMSPMLKLVWLSRHDPGLTARVRWWVGLKDYVLQHLTGQLVTELSSASATGLLNLADRDWDASALALYGVLDAAFAGRPPETEAQFAKAMAAGTSAGTILSWALRYVTQLHKARLALDAGEDSYAAMRSFIPPIHFRREDAVKTAKDKVAKEIGQAPAR